MTGSFSKMKFLVVIPAYNEEAKIRTVASGVIGVAGSQRCLVVDDGSTDSTLRLIKGSGLSFITRRHMGKGAALRAGFEYALSKGFDWVITMDGDGQHDPEEIPAFLETIAVGDTDMVVGTRMLDTASMPLVRLATNRFMSSLISFIAGRSIPDTQCGFRAVSADVLRKVVLMTSHYDTESELLIKAARMGFRITSIPIATIYDGSKSKINKLNDTLRFIRLLLRISFEGGKG